MYYFKVGFIFQIKYEAAELKKVLFHSKSATSRSKRTADFDEPPEPEKTDEVNNVSMQYEYFYWRKLCRKYCANGERLIRK